MRDGVAGEPPQGSASPSRGAIASLIVLGLTLALVAIAAMLPGVPTGRYAQDVTALLDGAYRIDHGLWPHRDFMVPFGGLVLVQAWVALKLETLAAPFAILQVTSWLLLLPTVLVLAARQPSRWRAGLLVAAAGLMALVPYVVESEPIPDLNYNGVYNRAASAVLLLLLAWIFGPKRGRRDILLVAWLLLLCLGWKISHALVMLGLLGLAGLLSVPARRIGLGAVALLVAGLVAIDLATGGVVRGYGRDIAEMVRINRGGSTYFLSALAIRSLPALACGALVLAWLLARRGRAAGVPLRRAAAHPILWLRARRRPLWIAATLLAVLATESQGTGNLGLFPVTVLLLGPLVGPLGDRPARPCEPLAVALATLLAVTAAYPFLETVLRRAGTMATRQAVSLRREPALDRVIGPVLVARQTGETAERYAALWHGPEAAKAAVQNADAAFSGGMNATEPAMSLAWAREVAAMGRLVRERDLVRPAMRVTTIGYVEPFGRLLGATPIPGTRLWLDPWRTVGVLSAEEARATLAPADAVFVQRCPLKPQLQDMIAHSFQVALDADFAQAASTGCYDLWLRRSR